MVFHVIVVCLKRDTARQRCEISKDRINQLNRSNRKPRMAGLKDGEQTKNTAQSNQRQIVYATSTCIIC